MSPPPEPTTNAPAAAETTAAAKSSLPTNQPIPSAARSKLDAVRKQTSAINQFRHIERVIAETKGASRINAAGSLIDKVRGPSKNSSKHSPKTVASAMLGPDQSGGVPATLDLIVAATPKSHLGQHISRFVQLREQSNVVLGTLYVVDPQTSSYSSYGFLNDSTVKKALDRVSSKENGRWPFQILEVKTAPNRLPIARSPTWIVHVNDKTGEKDYIFEGDHLIVRKFSNRGLFLGHNSNGAKGPLHLRSSSGDTKPLIVRGKKQQHPANKSTPVAGTNKVQAMLSSSPAVRRQLLDRTLATTEPPKEYIELPPLKQCTRSNVRRTYAGRASRYSRAINYVFYDPRSPTDQSHAKVWGPDFTVPWSSGDYIDNPNSTRRKTNSDPRLLVANFSGIRCLPTRVIFRRKGSASYLELREGAAAWELPNRGQSDR